MIGDEEDIPQPVPDNFISLDFADGEYDFRLNTPQIAELQEKCGRVGIGAIFARLMAGRYIGPKGDVVLQPLEAIFKWEDIRETIRLGLIGGGRGVVNEEQIDVTPREALKLVQRYVDTRPALENWRIAAAILSAFVIGYNNPKAEKKTPSTETMETEADEPPKDGSTSLDA